MFLLLVLSTLLVDTQQQSFSDPFSSYGYSSVLPSTFSQLPSSSPQSLSSSYSMGGMNDISLWSNPSGLQTYQSYLPTQQTQGEYIYKWLKNLCDELKLQTKMLPTTQNSYMSNNYGIYPTAQSSYAPNNYGMYQTVQSSYVPNNYGMSGTAQSSYIPTSYGTYPTVQSSYVPNSYGTYGTAQSSYIPTSYGTYPTVQSSYVPNSYGTYGIAQSSYMPSSYGTYPTVQSSYVPNNDGMYGTAQSSYMPNSYGTYPTAQSSYVSNNYGMYVPAQSSYMPNSYGTYPTAQNSYIPNSNGLYSTVQSSYTPYKNGKYSNKQNNYISNNGNISPMTSGYSSYYVSQPQTSYAYTHGPLAAPNSYHTHQSHKYSYGSVDYSMQLKGQNYPTYDKSAYGNYYPNKYYSSYNSQKPSYYSNNYPANTDLHYSSGKSQYPSYSSYYYQNNPRAHVYMKPTHGYSKNVDFKSYYSVNRYSKPSRIRYNTFSKNFGPHNHPVKNMHGILKKQQDDTHFDESGVKFPHIHILSAAKLFKLLHPNHGNGVSYIRRITNDEDLTPKTKIMRLWIMPKTFKPLKPSKMVRHRHEDDMEEAEAKESDISDNEDNEEVETEKAVAKPKDTANDKVDNDKAETTPEPEPVQKSTEKEIVASLDDKLARDSSNEINMRDNMINRDIIVTRTGSKEATQSTTVGIPHLVNSDVEIQEKSENKETNVRDSSYKTPEANPDILIISTETQKSISTSSPVTVIEH